MNDVNDKWWENLTQETRMFVFDLCREIPEDWWKKLTDPEKEITRHAWLRFIGAK